MKRLIVSLVLLAAAFAADTPPSAAQDTGLPSGCAPALNAQLIGRPEDRDYTLTDLAGFNVVSISRFGQTFLSDKACQPDPEQGALSVVANYGELSDSPETQARSMVFGVLARSHPDRTSANFPPITVTTVQIGPLAGAEALSFDTTVSGATVFRYALVFTFPDGAKGLLSASGPASQFGALQAKFRRIGEGLQPRRNVQEMRQDLHDTLDGTLLRLRAPIIDQALDACLQGETSTDAVVAHATSAGWPAFEASEVGGRHWRSSSAPANDSGKVTFGVSEQSYPHSVMKQVTCVIIGSTAFAPVFRDRLAARFPGAAPGDITFTLDHGRIELARPGGRAALTRDSRVGSAHLQTSADRVQLEIELVPIS